MGEEWDESVVAAEVVGNEYVDEIESTLPQRKLFRKWSLNVQDHISTDTAQILVPHTAGRYANKRFGKSRCPIVERLVNALMKHGRNTGKKIKAVKIVKDAFEVIHLLTGQNPVEVLVAAIKNGGPREDSTRIGRAGTVRRQSVDVSPLRRINQALYMIATGAREASFKNLKSISECLADELINASKGSSNSYAIKKKDELERVAKSNR